jgi:putative membrane protein
VADGGAPGTGAGATRPTAEPAEPTDTGAHLRRLLTAPPRGRGEWEAWLDGLVRRERFTISVVFPVTGAVLLVASAEGWLLGSVGAGAWRVPLAPLSFNPWLVLLGVLVMRSPLIVGVLPTVGRRAAAGVAALAAYAYAIEFVGTRTGWPYGHFEYVVDLGPTVGGIPLALPVFVLPLVMNAYLLGLLLLGERAARRVVRLPAVVALVVVMDLVLDPGAVALGFWQYAAGGPVYGVPLSNYAGWVLSATVSVIVLDAAFDRTALLDRLERVPFMLDDLVSFVILWGAINAWAGNWGAVAVAAAFGAGLLATDRFDASLLRLRARGTD